jgi:hypothetical protein
MGKGSRCRKFNRDCDWCLRSRTLHIAPTINGGFEILSLKCQPKKHENGSRNEFEGWKNKKIIKQWMKHNL